MTDDTLRTGNYLKAQIDALEKALDSIEWNDVPNDDATKLKEPVSRNPTLAIECDDGEGGREQVPVPMTLNKKLCDVLKLNIKTALDEKRREYEAL